VADDELAVRELVCDILEGAGYRTVAAADGDEVVRLALEHRPALLILDIMMPRLDGFSTIARLRGHPLTADTPIVVLTGQADPVFRGLSEGVGAVAYVTKPFSADQLTETVRETLARRGRP
jgi:CheY-like chemotaxis protein